MRFGPICSLYYAGMWHARRQDALMVRDLAVMRRSFARIGVRLAHGEAPDQRRVGVLHDKVRRIRSGGQPLVTMMQVADLGKGDDGPGVARLNWPGDRTVLAQS